jgi:hypothetical protein
MTDDAMNEAIRGPVTSRAPVDIALDDARERAHAAMARYDAAEPGSPEHRAADAEADEALNEARALLKQQREAETTSFDGGARETPPEGPPSMDSLIRAGHEGAKQRTVSRARDIDHLNERNRP